MCETAKIKDIEGNLFGNAVSTTSSQNLTDLKALLKRLNDQMAGGEWLVGGRMTLADIVVFCSIATVYQIAIDGGYKKAIQSLGKWMDKMAGLPVVTRRLGCIKGCQKTIPPVKAPAKK